MSYNLPIQVKPSGLSTEGPHIARCYSLVQLGTIYVLDKWQSQVRISWELPFDKRVFGRGKNPAPKTISKDYAANLYGSSWLKKHIISWMGQSVMGKLDQANTEGFDPFIVVGEPCILHVIHKRSSRGAWYEDIENITPLDRECPDQYNPTKVLTFENFDMRIFQGLPDFVQKKIMGSKEWEQLNSTRYSDEKPTGPVKDMPF